jgi:23S rRNA (pseudouridine1915-N3)-methyltransferase
LIWKIVAVGQPALGYARDGIRDYLSRIQGFTKIETRFLKPAPDVHAKMLAESEGHFRILLDERGKQFTSRGFAGEIMKWENRSIPRCAVLVGGADGWSGDMRENADLLWALGSLTLQHELALLVALEQIYRACTIKAGLPYHRD